MPRFHLRTLCRSSSLRPLPAIALGVVVLAAAGARAQGPVDPDEDYINPDRPGIADGSGVVGAGRFQIEAGLQRERRSESGGSARTDYVPALLRLGVGRNLELRLESNTYTSTRARDSEQGPTRSEGIQPVSVGFKYRFAEAADSQRPSMGVIVRLFPRSGTGNYKTRRATGDLRIAADWDFAPQWSLNPNIGVAAYEGDGGRRYTAALFAATLNYNPSKVVNVFVDIGGQYPETRNGRGSAVVDGGIAYIVGRDVQLDFSVGARVAGVTPARVFWAAGISKRF
jgi:hypothetical protein